MILPRSQSTCTRTCTDPIVPLNQQDGFFPQPDPPSDSEMDDDSPNPPFPRRLFIVQNPRGSQFTLEQCTRAALDHFGLSDPKGENAEQASLVDYLHLGPVTNGEHVLDQYPSMTVFVHNPSASQSHLRSGVGSFGWDWDDSQPEHSGAETKQSSIKSAGDQNDGQNHGIWSDTDLDKTPDSWMPEPDSEAFLSKSSHSDLVQNTGNHPVHNFYEGDHHWRDLDKEHHAEPSQQSPVELTVTAGRVVVRPSLKQLRDLPDGIWFCRTEATAKRRLPPQNGDQINILERGWDEENASPSQLDEPRARETMRLVSPLMEAMLYKWHSSMDTDGVEAAKKEKRLGEEFVKSPVAKDWAALFPGLTEEIVKVLNNESHFDPQGDLASWNDEADGNLPVKSLCQPSGNRRHQSPTGYSDCSKSLSFNPPEESDDEYDLPKWSIWREEEAEDADHSEQDDYPEYDDYDS